MAASMRVSAHLCWLCQKLKTRIKPQRCSSLCGHPCFVNSHDQRRFLSQETEKQKNDAEQSDSEDFFGIPKDFKLQNVFVQHQKPADQSDKQERNFTAASHRSTSKDQDSNLNGEESTSVFTSDISNTQLNAVDDLESSPVVASSATSNSRTSQSRIDKRRQKTLRPEAVFSTHFGSVTIDQTSVERLNMNSEEIAKKAQEIMYNHSLSSRESSIKNNSKSKPSTSEPQGNNEPGNQESLNVNKNSQKSVESNFFDDVYFPELSQSESTNNKYNDTTFKNNFQLQSETETQSTTASNSDPLWLKKSTAKDHSKTKTKAFLKADEECTQPVTGFKILDEKKISSEKVTNVFEEQYFSSYEDSLQLPSPGHEGTKQSHSANLSLEASRPLIEQEKHPESNKTVNGEFNEFDEQYFGDSLRDMQPRGRNDDKRNSISFNSSFGEVVKDYTNVTTASLTSPTPGDPFSDIGAIHDSNYMDNSNENTNLQPRVQNAIISNESFLKDKSKKSQKMAVPNLEKPETPYDLAMKIRRDLRMNIKVKDQEEEINISKFKLSPKHVEEDDMEKADRKLDSKGFRAYDDQVSCLENMTSVDIMRMLKDRIIFDHEDFLAIDKPYGLASFSQKNDRISVSELLPALAESLPKSFKTDKLHLVHGLDRDVTGAIILAKDPEAAFMLRAMYKNEEDVVQRFWTITKGVPSPPSGVIDIPIGEGKLGDIYKMILRPRKIKGLKIPLKAPVKVSKAPSQRAVTEYTVLSSYLQSALVECTLLTSNVKHQLRVHLAHGINTPILGDHKYSHFSKLAPQKLHKDMLDLLKVRQAKVRNIALHLHCRTIVLKNYKDRMIFLTTRPPPFFRDNLRSLKLSMPKK